MAHRMSNADNFWLSMDEPTNLMVITGFMEFNKPLDFNRLYATIDSRLASFPRFQSKITLPKSGLGVPNWEEDRHFDLRSHLQRIALPAPGDKTELQEMIGNLTVTPLDLYKPLWQVHLIENYGEGCVLFSEFTTASPTALPAYTCCSRWPIKTPMHRGRKAGPPKSHGLFQ